MASQAHILIPRLFVSRIFDPACLYLSSHATCTGKVTEQNLGKDFETLLGMLRPEESVNKDDIKILKEQIFGPNVFWVTETRATDDILDGGIVVCWQLLISYCLL